MPGRVNPPKCSLWNWIAGAWVEAAVLLEAKLMVLSKGLDVRSKEMHPKAI